ncbi:hypothetical protein RchiOBHm_Chr5g0017411 [Rosa chinensis]|uniref:Ethylene-responsive nuclear family protein n=1 Tax=Rosa chinensis TaxID=74649 RepID=A0A2P6Q6G5_ROSCH|nr:uncharacterized protein LOC112164760 [Rosa chinensis]PRQ29771.1 hypothetical protein RchiOBHm_Chr5g0017411 [Rosa chinensis]
MPLPWKKTRVGRISQMVADLQSPKKGGSLVVQTGFPASLIDLFVKNRDRLRKRSKNNNKKKNSEKRSDFDSVDRVSDPIVSCSEKGSGDSSILAVPSSGEIENFTAGEDGHGVSEDTGSRVSGEIEAGSSGIVVEESGRGSCGDLTSVFVAVAKVFAVVALALCTTKFAVGITLSAFLLLFLECVGKHFSCLAKPCSNAKSAWQYMAKRIGYAVLVLRSDVIVKEKSDGVVFELVEPGVESDSSFEEIEVVELKSSGSVRIDEGIGQKSLIEYLNMDGEKSEKIETGDHTEDLSVSVCKKSKSKGRKRCVSNMGAKLIKRFMPKKLRKKNRSGAEPEPKLSEVCVDVVEEGLVEQESQREGFSAEEEEGENSSMVSVNSVNKCEKQEADGIVTSLIVGKKGTESKGNFGYLILFLIALAGLVGGRVLALMLIITWCFMLKVIRSWSSSGDMPLPLKRCSFPISL